MRRRFTTHSLMALAEASLIALLVVGLIAGIGIRSQGRQRRRWRRIRLLRSISLALVVDNNGNGLPNRGDVVTFNISTSDPAPFVQLDCYQGGSLVLMGRKGYFEGSLDSNWNFGLSSGAWPSGSRRLHRIARVLHEARLVEVRLDELPRRRISGHAASA